MATVDGPAEDLVWAPAPARSSSRRHYGMDWLRIGAFQLLILYHIGMYFVPWDWHVKADQTIDWAVAPMMVANSWRLSLLFAVSGYASAAMLARADGVGAFLRTRAARLGIPLAFGMIVVTPIQPWIQLATQHRYLHDFGWFYLHDYWSFRLLHHIPLPSWQHLWFILYLLVYTFALGALLTLPANVRRTARDAVDRVLAGPLLVLLPILVSSFVRIVALPLAEDSHNFADDWIAHARHFPIFLLGFLLRDSAALWRSVRHWWRACALVTAVASAAVVWSALAFTQRHPLPPGWLPAYQALRVVQGWTMILALLGFADAFLDRDHRWRATLAEAVFPFYIIHQTIIIVVGWLLLGSAIGPPLRLAILLATTTGGCWLFYLVGRRIGPLRPLIGLKRHPVSPPTVSV